MNVSLCWLMMPRDILYIIYPTKQILRIKHQLLFFAAEFQVDVALQLRHLDDNLLDTCNNYILQNITMQHASFDSERLFRKP